MIVQKRLDRSDSLCMYIHKIWMKMVMMILMCSIVLLAGPVRAQAAYKKHKVSFGRKTLFVGEKQKIAFSGENVTYSFKSSNKKVLSVSKRGVLKAKKRGTATITITARWKENGKYKLRKKKYKVTVKRLKLKKNTITLKSGQSYTPVFNQDIGSRKWEITAADTAVVSGSGEVINALKPGDSQVTVKVGEYLSFTMTVKVEAVSLGAVSCSMLVNDYGGSGNEYLDIGTIMRREAGAEPVYYETSNKGAGSINGGVYHAEARGVNTIKVYAGGYVKTFYITAYRWNAHRGYLDMRPENTIDAFITAGTSGAAFCETDLQVTSDGVIVCLHNTTVNKMTDGTGSVHKKTYEEVRALTIDNGNGLAETNDRYIPTFEQYIRIVRQYNMIAVIELKEWNYANFTDEERLQAMQEIYRIICKYNMQKRCMVISFFANQFQAFYNANGDTGIPFGALAMNGAATCLTEGRKMELPNLSSNQTTKFGTYQTLDYSPVIGRKNLAAGTY